MREVTFSGRTFELEQLDALTLFRVLKLLAGVGERGKVAIAEIVALETPDVSAWLGPIFSLITVIDEEDLLRLLANLLQFPSGEVEGVEWLHKQRLDLDDVFRVVAVNVELTSDIWEVLARNFPILGVLRTPKVEETETEAEERTEGTEKPDDLAY